MEIHRKLDRGDMKGSRTMDRFGRPTDAAKTGSKPVVNGKQMLSAVKLNFNITRSNKAPSTRRKKQTGGIRSKAPKAATIIPRDIRKKFGARRAFTIEQLLSLRVRCKRIPDGVEEIDGVLQEGIGEETGMELLVFTTENNKEQESVRPKLNKSKAWKDKIDGAMDNTNEDDKKAPEKTKDEKNSPKPEKKTPSIRPEHKKDPAKEKKTKRKLPKIHSQPKSNHNGEPDVEPLKTTKNRWTPFGKKTREQQVLGKIRGILNKITLERFETLSGSLVDFIKNNIKTSTELSVVVSEIFTKTIAETHFGPLYAKLCSQLSELSFADPENKNNPITFTTALVIVCQKEFEKVKTPVDLDNAADAEERKSKVSQAKKDALGTVEFIGELYKATLIPDKICNICLKELVSGSPTDTQIECAYRLLLTIGKQYDATESGKKHLDQIFNQLKHSATNDVLQQRTRFLVDIVKERRKNGWPQGKGDQMKTLEQIHADYASEVGGRVAPAPRGGQPTFDEILTDATNRESKLLKFALSGGCAIRNPQSSEQMESRVDQNVMSGLINNLLMQSSTVVEESQQSSHNDGGFGFSDVIAEDSVEQMDEKDRNELKENGRYMRNFLTELDDDEKKADALTNFQKVVKKMGWPDKLDLVFDFFNFTVNNVDESAILGSALQSLIDIAYLNKEDLMRGMNEFCEYFSGTEMDVPYLISYFGATTLKLIQQGTLTVVEVNESLKKDDRIDTAKTKKKFGRRADYLAFILKRDSSIAHDPSDFLLDGADVSAWKAEYKLK